MCGIVYANNFKGKPVNKTVFKRYMNQRSRGSDGFGFYIPDKNRLTHNAREGRILNRLEREKKASEILFHHRFPTSTINVRNACHPFSTKDYFDNNYVLVHNGVIWNDDEVRRKHLKFGIEYVSEMENGDFNDSEGLAYEVAMVLEGWQDSVETEGSIAFIVIKTDKDGNKIGMYFGRNTGSPLKMKWTENSLTISSEGEGIDVEPNKMYEYSYETGLITYKDMKIPTGYDGRSSYNTYDGFGFGQSGYSDDDWYEGALISAKTPEEVERVLHKYDIEAIEKNRVGSIKKRLLESQDYNPIDAVLEGEQELDELKRRENILNDLITSDIADDRATDEYMEIPDKIWYLQIAVDELTKEAQGLSQANFFHTPIPNRVTRASQEYN